MICMNCTANARPNDYCCSDKCKECFLEHGFTIEAVTDDQNTKEADRQ